MNLACSILGALEVIDGKRWLTTLNIIKFKHQIPIITTPIQTAFYVEIALSICVGLFAILFAYLSYAVVREIGWVTYKKIGPDMSIQRKQNESMKQSHILNLFALYLGMYRTLQFFVLALKIDIFIEFLVSVFYLIQFALKSGFSSWYAYVFIVITILILPMLYFGRAAVSFCLVKLEQLYINQTRQVASESSTKMIIFILFQMCVVFQMVLIAKEATTGRNYWYVWICFGK
jgi:hypothetical protein